MSHKSIHAYRTDVTSFPVHLTKGQIPHWLRPLDRLKEILIGQYISPTLARRPHRYNAFANNPTIKGQYRAVCLGAIPLWAIAEMWNNRDFDRRLSGCGIAYNVAQLHEHGAEWVIDGNDATLGRLVGKGHSDYRENREVYTGGLRLQDQYRWKRFSPETPDSDRDPIDFMWEREMRLSSRLRKNGLQTVISQSNMLGAIVVEQDKEIREIQNFLFGLPDSNRSKKLINRVVSLETVLREYKDDLDYMRIDTIPFQPYVRLRKPLHRIVR